MNHTPDTHWSARRPVPQNIQARIAAAFDNCGITGISERTNLDRSALKRAAKGERLNTRTRLQLIEAANLGLI
jgi:hypothetical protein